ncbi:hypothetical protein FSP39_021081, partial [Pinctada imbricata]
LMILFLLQLVSFILIGVSAYARLVAIVTSLALAGSLIACGVFLFLIAIVGLVGAVKHHQVLLFFYMIILFLLFLLQFSLACACLAVNADQRRELARQGWKVAGKGVKNTVQNKFDCCGFSNDDHHPDQHPACNGLVSCCKNNTDYLCCSGNLPPTNSSTSEVKWCPKECSGCMDKLEQEIASAFSISGGVGLFFSFTEDTYLRLRVSILIMYKAMQKKFSGSQIIDLKNMVYDSNETIHFYRRCVAAQCRYFGGANFDPTDCTSNITGLCSNGDLTDSTTHDKSNSQCFLENVLLESLVSNIQSYCGKANHQTKIWVGYNRYVDIYHYDGSITAVYMCEVAENINGTSVYKWTSKCRSSSYELGFLCTRDNEPTTVIAGVVSGIVLIAVFFIVVFAVYCRGYNEREVPKLTRESYSGHSTRVYVKATDDLRHLPPVENDRHFTCDTSVKNEASCSSTLDSNNEEIYEAYDSDVIDSNADVSTAEETHYAVSNQCYAMVGGEDNRAFDEEDQDLHQSYDFVEPSASLRLPPRIKERDDKLDENVISKSSTFPVFQFSKDKNIEKYEIAENEYDHVETGKSIRLPPRIFEKCSTEDSLNVVERKSYIESSTNEITEESVEEDDIYDTQLASTIFKRQENLVADEEKDQAIASDLYKDMSGLSQRRRGSYVQMDIDDTYKVIDAHFSMKRK